MADILLIEDSLEVGQVIIEHLSAIGHTTVQATTIDHARELLISKKIDLVLADQLLPKGYGTAVTEDTSRLGIPLLLMTGHPETYEALRDGALPVLRKPFHLSELTEAIDGALAGGKA